MKHHSPPRHGWISSARGLDTGRSSVVGRWLTALALALSACDSESPPSATDGGIDRVAPDTAPPLDATMDVGEGGLGGDTGAVFVPGCESLPGACTGSTDPDCGRCQYRVLHGAACTSARPCDDLVLYWSNFGCAAEGFSNFSRGLLAAEPDLVIACVQPMYPGELLPVGVGAPEREDLLVSTVYRRLRPGGDLGVWSGANMLTAGCSAGASRTPVVSARTTADERWLGTRKNAACLSDGVVSIPAQDRFVGEGVRLGGTTCAGRHARVVAAYTTGAPVAGHACEGSPRGQCACDPSHAVRTHPGTCGDGDCLRHDSIMVDDGAGGFRLADGVTPSDFAIPRWRLITEGGASASTSARCEVDVVPREPFSALCAALDASPGHTCELIERPESAHCEAWAASFRELCLGWFRAL